MWPVWDYKNIANGQQLLRAVRPEAWLTINGKEYNVGGLYGQKRECLTCYPNGWMASGQMRATFSLHRIHM